MKDDKKIRYHCPVCGGTDVGREMSVAWDVESQEWVPVSDLEDVRFCHDCGDDVGSFDVRGLEDEPEEPVRDEF